METSLKQRIILLMEYYNFDSPNELAGKIGIRASKIYNVLDGKTQKSHTLIDEIANSLQEINKEWLENGNGEMLKMPNQDDQAQIKALKKEVERLRKEVMDLQRELLEIYKKK